MKSKIKLIILIIMSFFIIWWGLTTPMRFSFALSCFNKRETGIIGITLLVPITILIWSNIFKNYSRKTSFLSLILLYILLVLFLTSHYYGHINANNFGENWLFNLPTALKSVSYFFVPAILLSKLNNMIIKRMKNKYFKIAWTLFFYILCLYVSMWSLSLESFYYNNYLC